MTLISENSSGAAPSVDDLDLWADTFGLTFPVLSDSGSSIAWSYMMHDITDGYIYMPNIQVIGPGMEVLAVNEFEGGIYALSSLIEANLPY